MQEHRIKARLLSVTLLTLLLSGCAFNPFQSEVSDSHVASNTLDALVARDVVSVLRQIETLVPERTILGVPKADLGEERFNDALKLELQAAGYAMRSVGNGPDTIPVSYAIRNDKNENHTQSRTLTVSAGDVALRRTYIIDGAGNIISLGAMQVRGADARNLTLDNNIFSAPGNEPARIEPPVETVVLPDEQLVLDDSSAVSEVDTALSSTTDSPQIVTPSSGVSRVSDSTTISGHAADESSLLDLVAPSVPAPSQDAIDLASLPAAETTQNFMNLQESNFAKAFAEMGIIREKVLTFPNDSTFMGNENTARLNAMLEGFNAQSDVLSVIGCSLGATNHAGGQKALALGRALRVRDELLYSGIPEENILEEGCWAEEAFDQRMPRRGVVVTLKRRLG